MARRLDRLANAVLCATNPREGLIALRYFNARVYLDENEVIRKARLEGISWREIADILGMTESGARRRYIGRGVK